MTQSSPKKVEAGRKLAMKSPKVSFMILRITSLPKYPERKFLGHLTGAHGGGGGKGAPRLGKHKAGSRCREQLRPAESSKMPRSCVLG